MAIRRRGGLRPDRPWFSLQHLLVLALTSCSDHNDPTGPTGVLRPMFLVSDHQSVTLSPTTSSDTDGPHLLDSLPYLTLVHVVTTGGPQHEYWGAANPSHYGQLNQTLDAKGFYTNGNCRAGVYVSIGQTSIGYCTGAINPPQTDKWTIAEGQERVTWNPNPTDIWNFSNHVCGPGTSPCYTYDGSFTVTIDRLPATLSMVPSRYVVVAGGPVSVTAKATPSSAQGFTVPFTVQDWQWTPDGGSAGPVCGSLAICNFSPNASGTIQVNAIVNGVPQSKSTHIRVLCNPTGDSLLDSLPILDALKTDMDSGGFPNSSILNRRERKSGIYCDAGACIPVLYPPEPGDTPCETTFPADSSSTLMGQTHGHPFHPYNYWHTTTFDTIPDICKPPNEKKKRKAAGYGPSDADYNHAGGTGIPQWIMDADSIYFIPGIRGDSPADSAARVNGTRRWGRKVGSCTRV